MVFDPLFQSNQPSWGNPGTPASEHILCPSQIPNDNVPLSGQKRKPTTKEVLFYFWSGGLDGAVCYLQKHFPEVWEPMLFGSKCNARRWVLLEELLFIPAKWRWWCTETFPAVELVHVIPRIFELVFKQACLVMAFLNGRGERKYLGCTWVKRRAPEPLLGVSASVRATLDSPSKSRLQHEARYAEWRLFLGAGRDWVSKM